MSLVVLLLGGNKPETRQAFSQASKMIALKIGPVVRKSSFYSSPPWGFEHPDHFLNQVMVVESDFSPMKLLASTQKIEKLLGRTEKTGTHYESRVIDIDILFIDSLVIDRPELQIPHPRLQSRRFTLEPLNELMPHFVHPLEQKSIEVLLKRCPDKSEVKRMNHSFGP